LTVQESDDPHCRLLSARCKRLRDHRSAEQGDELPPFQFIELHLVPASQGWVAAYRI